LVIRERRQRSETRGQRSVSEEVFLVDNWVLVGSLTKTGGRFAPFVPSAHRFDYDTYKIILGFVYTKKVGLLAQVAGPGEWRRLLTVALMRREP
jgi:hypothetical protein